MTAKGITLRVLTMIPETRSTPMPYFCFVLLTCSTFDAVRHFKSSLVDFEIWGKELLYKCTCTCGGKTKHPNRWFLSLIISVKVARWYTIGTWGKGAPHYWWFTISPTSLIHPPSNRRGPYKAEPPTGIATVSWFICSKTLVNGRCSLKLYNWVYKPTIHRLKAPSCAR